MSAPRRDGAPLAFEILARDRSSAARVGRVETAHGVFDTPAFMPVGTQGTVKGLLPGLVAQTGAQIVLGNTYHLMLRPGERTVAALGDLHGFSGWPGPMLTDSGGYQAYSMSDLVALDDQAVTFRSVVDGSMVALSPERAIEVQNALGADIIMALDDCPPSVDPASAHGAAMRSPGGAGRKGAAASLARRAPESGDHQRRLDEACARTTRWLERCARAHARPRDQSLFGIVQGGTDLARRTDHAKAITSIDLPGYAIGGVAVGEGFEQIAGVVEHTAPLLPPDRPRYLMGVGYERDIVAAVRAGVDMFDCVLPTRNGRNAFAFTPSGVLRLRNAAHALDAGAIDAGCDCLACRPDLNGWRTPGGRAFSRGYIRHLFQAGEMLGPILVSLHNLRHFQRLMLDIRSAIREDSWSAFGLRWPVAGPALARGPGLTGGGAH